MQKVKHDEAINKRPEFRFADEFLKEKISTIANSWKNKGGTTQEEANGAHCNMVAQISACCLDIVAVINEEDIKNMNKSQGNVYKLNKYLALRQLCEHQLHGIMQGCWGITKDFIESDEFKRVIKGFIGTQVTKEEIILFVEKIDELEQFQEK